MAGKGSSGYSSEMRRYRVIVSLPAENSSDAVEQVEDYLQELDAKVVEFPKRRSLKKVS